jgi:hypothetical protein
MTTLDIAVTSQVNELYRTGIRLPVTDRLLLARLLLDSVLVKQIDEDTDWNHLSLSAFASEWDNDEDAIYDDWRHLYGISTG